MSELRPELEKLPHRMRSLHVHRGYPVPWFVEWVEEFELSGKRQYRPMLPGHGEPRFEIMSRERHAEAIRHGLCWVCGGKLGRYRSFVIGPMCAVNRTSAEPPCHRDCAEWSARNCPFLSKPHMQRRVNKPEGVVEAPGVALMRNPGVAMVWTTQQRDYRIRRMPDGVLFDIGDPHTVSFWAEGRRATREEVEVSIATGLPSLMELAEQEGDAAVRELDRYVARAKTLLPAA